jgi:hypothetical protein
MLQILRAWTPILLIVGCFVIGGGWFFAWYYGRKVENAWEPSEGPPDGGDLVMIARPFTPIEAHMLQSRLQADGVPAVVTDAHIVGANSFLTTAVGGVSFMVMSMWCSTSEPLNLLLPA